MRAGTRRKPNPTATELRHDTGQAAVELALALPVVVMATLGLVQLLAVATDQVAVELAAREGARAAAVAADPSAAAAAAARAAVPLDPLSVTATTGGGRVTVTVVYTSRTDVPLIGAVVGDVELRAAVTMSVEPP